MSYKILFFDGGKAEVAKLSDVYPLALEYLADWIQEGDILYYHEQPDRSFQGIVYNSVLEPTDAGCHVKMI